MTSAQVKLLDALMAAIFPLAGLRSAEYQRGSRDSLTHKLTGRDRRFPYAIGTAQADAYLAGYEYGKARWNDLPESVLLAPPPSSAGHGSQHKPSPGLIQFTRNGLRKEWDITKDGQCIGHIWYYPPGKTYCLRAWNQDKTAYFKTLGAAKAAALDALDAVVADDAGATECGEAGKVAA